MLGVRFARRGYRCEPAAPPLWCGVMTADRDQSSRASASKAPGLKQTRKLGALIRVAREAVPLTREEVRDEIGLSVTAQYWAEAGERVHKGKVKPHRLHATTLVKLAGLLGLTPLQLADCGRADAAALLRAPMLPGNLTEAQKTSIAGAVLTLRNALPGFADMVDWVGTATGDLPAPDKAADGA
jgi:transcriptional regulator with XRE-family HTH domain